MKVERGHEWGKLVLRHGKGCDRTHMKRDREMRMEIYKPGGEQGSGEEGGIGVYGETQARQSVWIFCKKTRFSGNKWKIISSWAHRQRAVRLVSKLLLSCMAKCIVLCLFPVCWDLSVPGWACKWARGLLSSKSCSTQALLTNNGDSERFCCQQTKQCDGNHRRAHCKCLHFLLLSVSLGKILSHFERLLSLFSECKGQVICLRMLGDTQMKRRRNTQNFMNFSFLPSWLGRTPLKLM